MLEQDESLADPMLDTWRDLVLEEAVPFSDTYKVLDAVRKNYATGILTNGFTQFQRQKIDKYNLADHVDFTLVSEEAGYHKPDPRVFVQALEMAGHANSSQTLYIGDNLVADIAGAQGAGITPVFMNAKNRGSPPDGVISIKKLSELLDLLGLRGF
jgi:HAD superfamily hydrolase (TIGR01549 family)